MLQAIAAARRTVRVESYIFARDAVGLRFIEELCAAARRGVEVLAVLDGFGSPHARSIAAELRAAGARVRVHGRLLSLLLGHFLRNHRKLLVVDGEVAFAGGINISAAQAGWADLAVEVRGPVCAALESALRHRRSSAAGEEVHFLLSHPRGGHRLRRLYLKTIARAQRSVRLAQVYFLPDRRILRALTSAARRGIDVRLLLAGPLDVPLIGAVSARICRRLLRAGVRVFRWNDSVLHAKAASIDDRVLLVGSFNLDPLSLVNEELLVEARDPQAARDARGWFDRHATTELTLEDCRAAFWRDLLGRFLSWAGFFVGRRLRRSGARAFAMSPSLQGGKP
jgi:cardiolipin synthase